MPDLVTELAERGKALEPHDRSRLVDLLLESLHEPSTAEVESAWASEIERRLAESIAREGVGVRFQTAVSEAVAKAASSP